MGGIKQEEKNVTTQLRIWSSHHDALTRKCQGSFSDQGVCFMSSQIHSAYNGTTHSALWWGMA